MKSLNNITVHLHIILLYLYMQKLIKVNCLVCNKEKEFRPCDIKRGHGKFCSISCSASYANEHKKHYDLTCLNCNSQFQSKSSKAIYCTATCKTKHRNTIVARPRNRGNLSTSLNKISKGITDECFNCGWNKTSCDIHHIQERANGGSDELSNLTILCPNCHRLSHKGFDVKIVTIQEKIDNESMKSL